MSIHKRIDLQSLAFEIQGIERGLCDALMNHASGKVIFSELAHDGWLADAQLPGQFSRCLVLQQGLLEDLLLQRVNLFWKGCRHFPKSPHGAGSILSQSTSLDNKVIQNLFLPHEDCCFHDVLELSDISWKWMGL